MLNSVAQQRAAMAPLSCPPAVLQEELESREEQERTIHPNTEPHHARNRTSVIDFFGLIWLASLVMVSMGALAAEATQMMGKFVRADGVHHTP